MIIRIAGTLARTLGGPKVFERFGVSTTSWAWKNADDKKTTFEISLERFTPPLLKEFIALLEKNKAKQGVGVLLRDAHTWVEATTGDAGKAKARTLRHFEGLLKRYLSLASKRWIYKRGDNGIWLAYYVNRVIYHPEQDYREHRPAYVEMELRWEEFEGKQETDIVWYDSEVRGYSVSEVLAIKGFYRETDDMNERYDLERARFMAVAPTVGAQYWAVGKASDDMDGNPKGRSGSWYWSRENFIDMDPFGEPSRVVVDVFSESPEDDRRREKIQIDRWFWSRPSLLKGEEKDDFEDLEDLDDGAEEEGGRKPFPAEWPVHPWVAVYHFAKHLRLKLHVNQLTEYTYDEGMDDNLVISNDQKGLIRLLIESKGGGFKDIVRGKSGGIVVLLAGPPGTGKTLTAEVYAEAEKRPLYSIQCSQLGTDATELEEELLKVFSRARRWNAVILLDEADVYVHARGNDMEQNAIVGVFLRVLEYQSTVLFLTTNRPDDVDDAIASRCIARLTYDIPGVEEQRHVWQVLAKVSGTTIEPGELTKILNLNPKLSGRDVKNLIKLARLMGVGGNTVTSEAVTFVRQFQPTNAAGRAGLQWAAHVAKGGK
jgi:hypothetical protein